MKWVAAISAVMAIVGAVLGSQGLAREALLRELERIIPEMGEAFKKLGEAMRTIAKGRDAMYMLRDAFLRPSEFTHFNGTIVFMGFRYRCACGGPKCPS